MSGPTSKLQHREWTKGKYSINTDPNLIPLATLNQMLDSDDMYWGKSMPEPVLRETVQNSLCFGLYHNHNSSTTSQSPSEGSSTSAGEFVGVARLITDFTTFAYLTDVHILPGHQGRGLGRWLVICIKEILDSMPYLRRTMLLTGDWKRSVPYYEELLGMSVMDGNRTDNEKGGVGLAVMTKTGPGVVGCYPNVQL